MKKRILSVFIALILAMGTFFCTPASARAVSVGDAAVTTATTAASSTDATTTPPITTPTTLPTTAAPTVSTLANRTVQRLSGDSRYETAVTLSKNGWYSAENAIIANGERFADALAGVPLSRALDAPILLTDGTTLSAAITDELTRLGVKNVYILGGSTAVSSGIQDTLAAKYAVERISGASRYETCANIARKLTALKGTPSRVFMVSSDSFADALAGSTTSALLSQPILFSQKSGTLDSAVSMYLVDAGTSGVTLLGGTAVISDDIRTSLSTLGISDVIRLSGNDRYETAMNVYSAYSWLFTGNGAAIATGDTFPDALAGGALCAKKNIPLLLLNNRTTVKGAYDALNSRPDDCLYVIGGTGALTDYTVNCLRTNTQMVYTPPAPPASPAPTGSTVTITGTFCNVRTGAGTSYTQIGKAYSGSVYKLYNTKAAANGIDWHEIDYNGKRGWICASYATVSGTVPPASGNSKNNAYIYKPNYKSKYYIVVYVGSQSVVVYGKDANGMYNKEVRKMTCSTGLAATPTPLGLFSLSAKYRWRLMLGDVYTQYASRFANNYLFHSVLYKKPDPSTLFPNSYRNLGKRASHGCVRLCTRDCKWIYDNCPMGTQVRIVNAKGPAGSPIPALNSNSKYAGWDPSDPSSMNPYNK